MALRKNFSIKKQDFSGSLTLENAYFKIINVNGGKNNVVIELGVFNNETIVDRQYYSFAPNMQGANFIKQAYEHLKTLPEFAGATDC